MTRDEILAAHERARHLSEARVPGWFALALARPDPVRLAPSGDPDTPVPPWTPVPVGRSADRTVERVEEAAVRALLAEAQEHALGRLLGRPRHVVGDRTMSETTAWWYDVLWQAARDEGRTWTPLLHALHRTRGWPAMRARREASDRRAVLGAGAAPGPDDTGIPALTLPGVIARHRPWLEAEARAADPLVDTLLGESATWAAAVARWGPLHDQGRVRRLLEHTSALLPSLQAGLVGGASDRGVQPETLWRWAADVLTSALHAPLEHAAADGPAEDPAALRTARELLGGDTVPTTARDPVGRAVARWWHEHRAHGWPVVPAPVPGEPAIEVPEEHHEPRLWSQALHEALDLVRPGRVGPPTRARLLAAGRHWLPMATPVWADATVPRELRAAVLGCIPVDADQGKARVTVARQLRYADREIVREPAYVIHVLDAENPDEVFSWQLAGPLLLNGPVQLLPRVWDQMAAAARAAAGATAATAGRPLRSGRRVETLIEALGTMGTLGAARLQVLGARRVGAFLDVADREHRLRLLQLLGQLATPSVEPTSEPAPAPAPAPTPAPTPGQAPGSGTAPAVSRPPRRV